MNDRHLVAWREEDIAFRKHDLFEVRRQKSAVGRLQRVEEIVSRALPLRGRRRRHLRSLIARLPNGSGSASLASSFAHVCMAVDSRISFFPPRREIRSFGEWLKFEAFPPAGFYPRSASCAQGGENPRHGLPSGFKSGFLWTSQKKAVLCKAESSPDGV